MDRWLPGVVVSIGLHVALAVALAARQAPPMPSEPVRAVAIDVVLVSSPPRPPRARSLLRGWGVGVGGQHARTGGVPGFPRAVAVEDAAFDALAVRFDRLDRRRENDPAPGDAVDPAPAARPPLPRGFALPSVGGGGSQSEPGAVSSESRRAVELREVAAAPRQAARAPEEAPARAIAKAREGADALEEAGGHRRPEPSARRLALAVYRSPVLGSADGRATGVRVEEARGEVPLPPRLGSERPGEPRAGEAEGARAVPDALADDGEAEGLDSEARAGSAAGARERMKNDGPEAIDEASQGGGAGTGAADGAGAALVTHPARVEGAEDAEDAGNEKTEPPDEGDVGEQPVLLALAAARTDSSSGTASEAGVAAEGEPDRSDRTDLVDGAAADLEAPTTARGVVAGRGEVDSHTDPAASAGAPSPAGASGEVGDFRPEGVARSASDRASLAASGLDLVDALLEAAAARGVAGTAEVERAALALAAAERALVGRQSAPEPGDPELAPQAGFIVEAPEGDGAGEESDASAVGGGGDLRFLVQERVNHVAGLIGSVAARRSQSFGVAIVKMRVDARGYVSRFEVERSSGSSPLDAEILSVLHLAEPYPAFRGWLRVAVPFRER